jgi:hypothetical protein
VDDELDALHADNERTRRRAARKLVAAYHDEQLRGLLETVRAGFDALDRGEITPLECDELIEHYRRSARALERFCGASGSGWERAARSLVGLRADGEEPDWWEAGARRAPE